MVTHNPNLAVVCDAEQIIYSSFERKSGSKITYTAGSIEDPGINLHIVNVLEGTNPAFDNRTRVALFEVSFLAGWAGATQRIHEQHLASGGMLTSS